MTEPSYTTKKINKNVNRWVESNTIVVLLYVHTAAGESGKIRSRRPATDAVERFGDALT